MRGEQASRSERSASNPTVHCMVVADARALPPSSLARTVREQGLQSLTRGIGPRTVYYAWVCAAFFGLYEAFRRYFEAHGL